MFLNLQYLQQKKSIILDGVMPNLYGSSIQEVLFNRAHYLMSNKKFNKPDAKLFKRRVELWVNTNRTDIEEAYINRKTNEVFINFTLQCLSLQEAIDGDYIQIKSKKKNRTAISIPYTIAEKINYDLFIQDISRELLLSISLILTNTAIAFLRIKYDNYIILQCIILIGLVKGVIKTASDILSTKTTPLSTIPWNCLLEIWAEIAGEIFLFLSGKKLHTGTLNTFKNLFKCSFEQIARNNSFSIATNSLFLEMFKSGLNEIVKTFACTLLFTQIFVEQIMASCVAIILSTTFISIFINQCIFPTHSNSFS